MEADRLNSPDTSAISVELFGHHLQFSQDPNSKHHGTTVWDASLVLVKFLEKNSRKGRFCPSKLKGKRVIELGAGCGVAGFGMAMLGCDVIATDQAEVLPLLRRNVERNTSRILQTNPDFWVDPDVVYAEQLLEPLLQTISALSGSKTVILMGYEIRSTGVHEQMLDLWRRNFDFKTVPLSKMHHKYQHPSIQLFIMGPKPLVKSTEETTQKPADEPVEKTCTSVDEKIDEDNTTGTEISPKSDSSNEAHPGTDPVAKGAVERDSSILEKLKTGKLSELEARRYGSIAARLLRDIQIK